ncbi:MAG: CRISPR-associated helicase Cas3' [Candidatus Loosdrechtia sp.]|uniref:CRISPR-associated helicase Cas3' n=1 Tax=Candidatus Loosdrechtia sp. TaxID=3101272 RepID=UPI003A5D80A1|nr:MAG: CRISPR-associated helicase Cas3' [Candidatus Jettenia sp. AMX2]
MKELYAHSANSEGQKHRLDEHLKEVASLAKKLADKFGAGNLAYLAGLWHDLGKINPRFQDYLEICNRDQQPGKVPHAIWGAALAYNITSRIGGGNRWEEISLIIAGHHSGIDQPGSLSQRMEQRIQQETGFLQSIAKYLHQLPSPPSFKISESTRTERELFIRMVFSALVDADYLNTEKHFNNNQYELRQYQLRLEDLLERFYDSQTKLMKDVDAKLNVNRVRKDVYEFCDKVAVEKPGIYRLTVPTGGGKTRSSLAFALKHAIKWEMDRVVVAIPYTSIIDQTAREYRKILGNDAVLEHHSQVNVPADESQDLQHVFLKLASENWSAPLVVTTTVQLFESIFSNQPGKARKLHNLAKSVILIDEVQALPPELLTPTLDVLKELAVRYGVSVVLCTATQPEYETVANSIWNDVLVTDIVPKEVYARHFKELQRIKYCYLPPITWHDLAATIRVLKCQQVLVVLNTRKDALALLSEMGEDDSIFHLSTLLCGSHRKIILHRVRKRLKKGLPVKLISTQIIEAGVDIDFPAVYRAIGPLDRIVQAAGRCNREGKRPKKESKVFIFESAEGGVPRGPYKTGLEKTKLLFLNHNPEELHDTELHKKYFSLLFDPRSGVNTDRKNIQNDRELLDYPSVAMKYKMIEQDTSPVIIPCKAAETRLKEWQRNPSRRTWQRLQPLVVNVYNREISKMLKDKELETITEGLYLARGQYDKLKGLIPAIYDPSDLIAM